MKADHHPSTECRTLKLDGELTIQHAGSLRTQLLEAMASCRHLRLSVNTVSAMDLSFLQMLCALHRSTLNTVDKHITLSNPLPDSFREIIRLTGLCRHTGCAADLNHTCIWAHLEENE